ncbi:MAG TPA: deoxyribose-phosphate aldolase [Candidatus Dorea faecigallinarum]|jgi:deoxyribose-phosphate aldolase|nr:deoxyribose-phosphate aldolase [Candidatus Dorea faecigallinarum]
METKEMLQYIDHTLLKPVCTWDEIETLCKEALSYHTASVCIPPSYVKRAREAFGPELPICTVIGFPLGYNPAEVKVCEARTALRDGADELDMVINLGDVKNRDFEKVYEEIRALRETAGSRILKVIVETCYLTRDEKIRLCEIVTKAGADYIKTSTGFGTAGATMEDILLFKEHIGSSVKIKAAGGIRTREDLEAFIQAGCSRIGTSSAVKLLCSSAE